MSTMIQEVNIYATATLVDRTGKGGDEFWFDAIPFVFKKGQTELGVPRFVAEWLVGTDQKKVWTEEGQFVSRYGIKEAPQEVIDVVGPEACDCSPITLKGDRIEGWDTSLADSDRAPDQTLVKTAQTDPKLLRPQPGDFRDRQPDKGAAFDGKRRG